MPLDPFKITGLKFWDAVDAFAAAQEPAIRDALRAALAKLRESVTTIELERIIANGDVEALMAKLDLDPVRYALRDAATRSAAQASFGFPAAGAGATTGALVGAWPATIRIRFDTLNRFAVAALQDFESRAIDVISTDIRAGVTQVLSDGLAAGLNPRTFAPALREMLGLPPNLARAVEAYRQQLLSGDPTQMRAALNRALRDGRYDRATLSAIARKAPLDADLAERAVERMRARAIALNAETIARTGAMDALNLGNQMAWHQAIDDGKVTIDSVRRCWIVARDERTCPRCLTIPALNPDGRGMGEAFVTPFDGLVMIPTLHFCCRCIIFYKFIS